jgi:hypothetical protein
MMRAMNRGCGEELIIEIMWKESQGFSSEYGKCAKERVYSVCNVNGVMREMTHANNGQSVSDLQVVSARVFDYINSLTGM